MDNNLKLQILIELTEDYKKDLIILENSLKMHKKEYAKKTHKYEKLINKIVTMTETENTPIKNNVFNELDADLEKQTQDLINIKKEINALEVEKFRLLHILNSNFIEMIKLQND